MRTWRSSSACSRGETVCYRGQFSATEKAVLNVLPHQGRVPPIYVAVLAREATYHVGRRGDRVSTVPYASCRDFADIANMLAEFRKGRAEAGLAPHDEDHIVTLHTHVPASDEEARRQAKPAYDLYVDTRLYAKKHVYEDVLASGLALFGSVETIAKKVRQLYGMGVRHVATMHNFGALEPHIVERSMMLFAREVMPQLKSAMTGA